MASVYSTVFLEIEALNGSTSVLVPPGVVYVVRDIDAFTANPGPTPALLQFQGNAGGVIWQVLTPADVSASYPWRGRQVFVEGQRFTFLTDNPTDVRASGYVLTLP